MLREIPEELENDLGPHYLISLRNGLGCRRVGIFWALLYSGVTLAIMGASFGITPEFYIALIIAICSLCILWAIYSVSASLNTQCDTITKLLVHYSESSNKTNVRNG